MAGVCNVEDTIFYPSATTVSYITSVLWSGCNREGFGVDNCILSARLVPGHLLDVDLWPSARYVLITFI